MTDIPLKLANEFSEIFLSHYKSRIFKNYVLGVPITFSIIWNVLKIFMDDITLGKIVITKKN